MTSRPRLYGDLAPWFHLLTAPQEYAEEADIYRGLLLDAADQPIRTVLELGSGGGNNASHLKRHFDMTLSDLSGEMLELSRTINPECEHVEGDMRTLRLGRAFDAVFVHDAIDYMTTTDDLRAAVETAFVHLRPAGVALFVPDFVKERFEPRTSHGGNDGPGRALRYLEWDWDPDPEDDTYLVDFGVLLREEDGTVRVEHDRHECGVFARETWLGLLRDVGFQAESRVIHVYEEVASEALVGTKPG
jgi:SAM-dependent methyltransferase